MNLYFTPNIVHGILCKGLTVTYVDPCPVRRMLVEDFREWAHESIMIIEPKISGMSSLHCNVLVLVNEHEYDPRVLKDLLNIPGFLNGIGPAVVRITLE